MVSTNLSGCRNDRFATTGFVRGTNSMSKASSILRIGLGLILVVLLVIPFAMRPSRASVKTAGEPLVVLTPHNEHIRFEVGEAFRKWHQENFGSPAEIDWRYVPGSSEIQRLLTSLYEDLARRGKEDTGCGYDIVIGGGDYIFDKKLKVGVKVKDEAGNTRSVSITQPTVLDPAFVKDTFPEPTIAARRLYDADSHWWGVVLSTFGIIYNTDMIKSRGLPTPNRWDDLTDPKFYGWVAMVDPSFSGSIRTTYEAVIQRYGFEHGWKTMREVSANARYFSSESSQVPVDVGAGEVAAGMCVDHYARYQAAVVGRGRLEYVAPMDGTIVNPDPVAVLRGAPHRELAERFVKFLLSEKGQFLFSKKVGTDDGPIRYELIRPPVRRDTYDKVPLPEKDNLFLISKPLPPGVPPYGDVIPTVLHAMAIDVHDELHAAWRTIINEKDPTTKEAMLKLFHELPFTQEELIAAGKRWNDPSNIVEGRKANMHDRIAWTKFFVERYKRITEMASS